MTTRIPSFSLMACSVVLFVIGTWMWWLQAERPQGGLLAEASQRDVGVVVVGRETAVGFALHDASRNPVRVVRLAPC